MGVKVQRVLVQGTVNFVVSCNDLKGLVTLEQASNEKFMEEWFEDKAFKMIDIAEAEVEYVNTVPVMVSEETAEKFTDEIVSSEEWRQIVAESKKRFSEHSEDKTK
jgi:hypothetical protein